MRSEDKEQFEEEDRLLKATWGLMRQALRSLGVEMNMWPSAVSSHEVVSRAVSSGHASVGSSGSSASPSGAASLSGATSPVDLPHVDVMKRFMREAMREAQASSSEGGFPSGAVLVLDEKVVARGHNKQIQHLDLTAHAEIDCLRQVDSKVDFRNCVLYSTVAPCPMCLGAARQFGIPLVVAGSKMHNVKLKNEAASSSEQTTFIADCLEDECHEIVSKFLRDNPDKPMFG